MSEVETNTNMCLTSPVTVHVANKHNAGSADASCSLGFPGHELHEFISNHVLERRSIHTFHVDDISGDGDFSSMNLACSRYSTGILVGIIVVVVIIFIIIIIIIMIIIFIFMSLT